MHTLIIPILHYIVQEQKRKEEEEAAAKVYDSFVESFTVDEDNTKTFIRGESSITGSSGSDGVEGKAGETYKLSSSSKANKDPSDVDRFMNEMKVRLYYHHYIYNNIRFLT